MAKPIRLGKAAGELNVGMSTLVEFLESNGVSIDASPNTKLHRNNMICCGLNLLRIKLERKVQNGNRYSRKKRNNFIKRQKRRACNRGC